MLGPRGPRKAGGQPHPRPPRRWDSERGAGRRRGAGPPPAPPPPRHSRDHGGGRGADERKLGHRRQKAQPFPGQASRRGPVGAGDGQLRAPREARPAGGAVLPAALSGPSRDLPTVGEVGGPRQLRNERRSRGRRAGQRPAPPPSPAGALRPGFAPPSSVGPWHPRCALSADPGWAPTERERRGREEEGAPPAQPPRSAGWGPAGQAGGVSRAPFPPRPQRHPEGRRGELGSKVRQSKEGSRPAVTPGRGNPGSK